MLLLRGKAYWLVIFAFLCSFVILSLRLCISDRPVQDIMYQDGSYLNVRITPVVHIFVPFPLPYVDARYFVIS